MNCSIFARADADAASPRAEPATRVETVDMRSPSPARSVSSRAARSLAAAIVPRASSIRAAPVRKLPGIPRTRKRRWNLPSWAAVRTAADSRT
ncbi:hypothetical protein [Pengzhenrongella phosphoraccumulans]|uniref:hypothetical protein n=1 Tax=Pengzhenrongella phosphoraccumulans TaxID=3114394 RepID=UPI00388D4938